MSFISSDILMFFLRNNINEQRRDHNIPDQTTGVQGEPRFHSSGSVPPYVDDGKCWSILIKTWVMKRPLKLLRNFKTPMRVETMDSSPLASHRQKLRVRNLLETLDELLAKCGLSLRKQSPKQDGARFFLQPQYKHIINS
ncbi:hypothetical protein HAX54_041326 [Datura stramonium]|uniref:Uncharacterized protein n=1 Tax=Datura stramonium TaxID=4076 RepID=A0ABS8VRT3_DATST|nr:hypothetical protein [Datura stramonium]